MNETRFRAVTARGISGTVDRDKGIIYGIAVNTEGEALGHGVHLEKEFIADVVKQGNESASGIKSRFGHPNMSSSSVGTLLGRVKNFKIGETPDGMAVARGDLHLSESAKTTPNGDLYTHVLDLAEHDPEFFGTSIVFNASNHYRYNDQGEKVYRYAENGDGEQTTNAKFGRIKGKTFVELGQLKADDVVDSPAANPNGLFSQFSESPAKAMSEFLDDNPQIWDMFKDIDEAGLAEIFSAFRERYSANRAGLESLAAQNKKQEHVNMSTEAEKSVTQDAYPLSAAPAEASPQNADQLKGLLAAFDKDVAIAAFDKGQTVEQVKASLYDSNVEKIASLEAEIAELKDTKAPKQIEGEAVPFQYSEEVTKVATDAKAEFEAKVEELGSFTEAMIKYPELAEARYK